MTNNKTAIKNKYKKYISQGFDLDLLGLPKNSTPKARASAFLLTVKKCQGVNHGVAVLNHIQGLGQGLYVEYNYHDILKRAKRYGLIKSMLQAKKYDTMNKEKALERVENQICDDYWRVIATYILQMAQ